MEIHDIIYVTQHHVKCEGEGDSLGHPLIYLEIKTQEVICPYCSRIFKLKSEEV